MLLTWKDSYMQTRQAIEDSGKGQRWEFDKKRLFLNTDYIANVCKELFDVSVVCIIQSYLVYVIATIQLFIRY